MSMDMMKNNSLILAAGLMATAMGCQNATSEPEVESASEIISKADIDSRSSSRGLDRALRRSLRRAQVSSVPNPAPQSPAMVKLGQNLFFDKELSGPRSIACSTCHHPLLGSGDSQSQSRAQGAVGLGSSRRHGDLSIFLPRNTLTIWNRGVEGWDVMFWDGRLGEDENGNFFSPAGDQTPQGFNNALSAFPIIPVTPREEMRGFVGELDRFGNANELETIADDDFIGMWEGVVARVVAIPEYQRMIDDAFPQDSVSNFDIVDMSNAIGAFMTDAFTALDTPFDRYLAGDRSAMSDSAKRGALLFYGRAQCSSCHAGALQTDFSFHNIAAPQVGTGNGNGFDSDGDGVGDLDFGRERFTSDIADRFKFRTPSLRNVELNSPYMHNGAYAELEDAVRHHLDPQGALEVYDDTQVEPELHGTFQDDPSVISDLLTTIDPALAVRGRSLREREIQDILAFLNALTDPASLNMHDLVPDEVPSGLPLAD